MSVCMKIRQRYDVLLRNRYNRKDPGGRGCGTSLNSRDRNTSGAECSLANRKGASGLAVYLDISISNKEG